MGPGLSGCHRDDGPGNGCGALWRLFLHGPCSPEAWTLVGSRLPGAHQCDYKTHLNFFHQPMPDDDSFLSEIHLDVLQNSKLVFHPYLKVSTSPTRRRCWQSVSGGCRVALPSHGLSCHGGPSGHQWAISVGRPFVYRLPPWVGIRSFKSNPGHVNCGGEWRGSEVCKQSVAVAWLGPGLLWSRGSHAVAPATHPRSNRLVGLSDDPTASPLHSDTMVLRICYQQ